MSVVVAVTTICISAVEVMQFRSIHYMPKLDNLHTTGIVYRCGDEKPKRKYQLWIENVTYLEKIYKNATGIVLDYSHGYVYKGTVSDTFCKDCRNYVIYKLCYVEQESKNAVTIGMRMSTSYFTPPPPTCWSLTRNTPPSSVLVLQ